MDSGASSTIPPSPGSLPPPASASTTVMASEVEVSNGFVKNGTSLPYVIETNKSGNRKRSSKILPVCGICGKKFVCVTTMKRHLVTHTGERPFNCKVCGKQYTQKGNLRVHERTHRNDRPFECNICHQKFYRKEPMQKHQWRQHGIGHYKSRPNGPEGTAIGIIGAESILFNSVATMKPDDQPQPGIVFETHPNTPEAEDFSEEEEEEREALSTNRAVTKYITDTHDTEEEIDNNCDHDDPRKSLEMLKFSQDRTLTGYDNHVQTAEDGSCGEERPMKLKMKLAQAYLKEVKEEREREERDSRGQEGRDSFEGPGSLEHIEENLGDIQLSHDITITEVPFETVTVATTPSSALTAPAVEKKECVECVCKACGSKCRVTDPYNFSCPVCNVKYTSLPTHMIADPLQCIGCLKVFEHKPAMKEHQSSKDKDRPFVCCKCGYEFKQKAHLQKHQWRIHRRKLEPDPNVKEAEAILKAVNEMSSFPATNAPVEEMASQQISDRGEAEIRNETIRVGNLESFEGTKPLDLSPCKMYGTANSITAWVKQVETARTPPVPDISIHRRPVVLPTEPLAPGQLDTDDQVSVTIQLLGPAKLPPLVPPTAPPSLPRSLLSAQPIAVKSKPPIFGVKDPVFQKAWRTPILEPREENPLLNQKNYMEDLVLPSEPLQQSDIILDSMERVFKRPRQDFDALYTTNQSQPADLSIHQKLDFSPPSPPLNLSKMEDVPYDYTISRSELITGQLRRIRNQDKRSGI